MRHAKPTIGSTVKCYHLRGLNVPIPQIHGIKYSLQINMLMEAGAVAFWVQLWLDGAMRITPPWRFDGFIRKGKVTCAIILSLLHHVMPSSMLCYASQDGLLFILIIILMGLSEKEGSLVLSYFFDLTMQYPPPCYKAAKKKKIVLNRCWHLHLGLWAPSIMRINSFVIHPAYSIPLVTKNKVS